MLNAECHYRDVSLMLGEYLKMNSARYDLYVYLVAIVVLRASACDNSDEEIFLQRKLTLRRNFASDWGAL